MCACKLVNQVYLMVKELDGVAFFYENKEKTFTRTKFINGFEFDHEM